MTNDNEMPYEEFEAYMDADQVPLSDLLARAESEDPVIALTGIAAVAEWLSEVEESAVLSARVEGMPWSRIGQLLGRSKQAVWEKHRDAQDVTADE